ncbi:SBBP repeat-containing protein [Oceanithermus profundus]
MLKSFHHDLRIRTSALAALALLALNACSPKPAWQADPTALTFTGQVGEAAPPAQTLTLKNAGGGAQPFTLGASAGWIHVAPTSGDLGAGATASLQVSVEACTEAGTQTGTLTVGGAATLAVGVTRNCDPEAGTLLWARQFGSEDDDDVRGMVVDAAGNTYVVGSNSRRTDTGFVGNVFLVKHDADGNPVWKTELDSDGDSHSLRQLFVNEAGEVYAVGSTSSDFDGSGGNPAESADVILLKLNADGSIAWKSQLGSGGPGDEYLSDYAVAPGGKIYVAGETYGDFSDPNADYSDPTNFLAAFDASGETQWVWSFDRSISFASTQTLDLDPDGNLIYCGRTIDSQTGRRDAFAEKRDPEAGGGLLWHYDFVADSNVTIGDTLVDAAGDVFVYGSTAGSFPGQTNAGLDDVFVAKLNGSGSLLWLTQFGGPGRESAGQIVVDASGNVYLLGSTNGSLNGQTAFGDSDLFVAKLTGSTGDMVWATQFGTSEYDQKETMALGSNGRLIVSGRTQGSFPGFTLSGRMDMVVAAFVSDSGEQIWLTQLSSEDNGSNENRDWIAGFGLDAAGNAYLAGQTQGVYPGETPLGEDDAFVIKVQH